MDEFYYEFYYVECPHCSFKFAIEPFLGQTITIENIGEFQGLVDEDDFVQIHCPRCGKRFTIIPAKTKKVFIDFIE